MGSIDGTLRGDLTPTDVARQLHAFNAGYTLFIRGGSTTPPELTKIPTLDAAPPYQREVFLGLVKAILNKPDITPAQVHEEWVNLMKSKSWTRGAFSEANKTHPLLVPYDDLEPAEAIRAVTFLNIVQPVMVPIGGTQRQTAGVGAVLDGY